MKIFLILTAILLSSCGVKAPPIAPNRPAVNTAKTDCSPTEADCDATDPDYVPRKK